MSDGTITPRPKNRDPIDMRVAEALVDGAVAGMRQEFPMHFVEQTGRGKGWRQVRLSHPTHMPEPRYYRITIKVEDSV